MLFSVINYSNSSMQRKEGGTVKADDQEGLEVGSIFCSLYQ